MTNRAEPDLQVLWAAASGRLHDWFERRTGQAQDADDLVQETFLRVQSGLERLRDAERLDAWIHVIATNVLGDHHRRRGRVQLALDELEPEQPEPDGPDVALHQAVAGWIEAFLERLEPEDAAVLRTVDLEGRPQSEVARELGLAQSSVRSRVQRARARLRRHLEACCSFAFDARGNLTGATRREKRPCDCDS
jgi:RNA polymerase sigma-70 factor (ECF subfamily)